MRNLRYLALALAIAPSLVACGGDGTDPTVSGVFPSSAFMGRQMRVEISGDATEWTAPTVSFGDGVTVGAVTVASPTALFVDVTVAPDAAPGLRTITVTDGDALTLNSAFDISSPIAVKLTGTIAQGSVAIIDIKNKDVANPFDTTTIGDGFFTPIQFVGIEPAGPAGVNFGINDVQAFSMSALVYMDVDAAPGAFSFKSGLTAEEQISFTGATIDVAPRSATPITAGTPAMGSVGGRSRASSTCSTRAASR